MAKPKKDPKDVKQDSQNPNQPPEPPKSLIRNNPYQIPPGIINQLKEHSTGFILITLDHEGNYNYNCCFDNNTISEAVELKTLKILECKQQINNQIIYHQVTGCEMEDEDGDEDGE